MRSARSQLVVTAVLAGVAEIGMAIQFALDGDPGSPPAAAGAFAVTLLLSAWFARADRLWPVVTLAVLFALEVAFVPFYQRSSWVDWVEQGGFLALSLVGFGLGLAAVAEHRRTTRTALGARA